MLKNITLLLSFVCSVTNAQVGINTSSPRTSLDINGTISGNEQIITIASKNAEITKISQSQLSILGTLSGTSTLKLPSGVPGQRLVVVNNTDGEQDIILGKYAVRNGDAVEFVFSNNQWRALKDGDSATNVSIYGTTLPIMPHASTVSGITYTNKTNTALDIMSPGGDGQWHIVSQKNISAKSNFSDMLAGSDRLTFANSRKIVEYEFSGQPFDETKVFPIVTAGNNSTTWNDTFVANVISFTTINGKSRLKLSINRVDYFSDNSVLTVNEYDASPSNWQGKFFVNLLLATKN